MPSRSWCSFSAMSARFASLALGAAATLAVTACGPYEQYEPATPYAYAVQAEPPSSAELAANPPPRVSASDEVAIGEPSDAAATAVDTDPTALTAFREELAPHGTWVDDDTYGTVWMPNEAEVGTDFQPYVTAGHWTYDDRAANADWVWVSDYSWGWAPFHYGRWVRLPARGWVWIPGRTYSGAWVVWRTGPVDYGYVGWAPAPPSWYWYNGVAVGWGFGWYSPYYVYCPRSYVYDPYVHRHVVYRGAVYDEAQARTRPYEPPAGRTIATPGVGSDGSGRTVASPRVAPRGPTPSEVGLPPDAVARPPASDPGLSRARAMAAPRATARANAFNERRSGNLPSDGALVSPPNARSGAVSPSVSSRLDATARAPQYQGVQPSNPRPSWNGGASSYAAPPATVRPSAGAQAAHPWASSSPSSSPSYRSSPSSSPTYRSSPSVSSSPSFRSSPSSSPSFRSSPSSSPSFRSSPSSSPSFRSSPSSSPSFRSSPSVRSSPSFRSSPPSSRGSSSPSIRGGGGRRGR